ncbi:hypothetical protein LCGC14_1755000 [marine sediment metagenome]|uniref:SprT-like domain-containing protein n=1 Tax=marine sediment metagenome TaxID=412755 RepID=A0A0F9JHY5_9ZZZZ
MPKPLTLLNRFDRLNQKHFRGKLKRPSMVRFSKNVDPLSDGCITIDGDGRVYILIHTNLKPFNHLLDLVLTHEMVHQQHKADDTCGKVGSKHHRKMLSILAKEPRWC